MPKHFIFIILCNPCISPMQQVLLVSLFWEEDTEVWRLNNWPRLAFNKSQGQNAYCETWCYAACHMPYTSCSPAWAFLFPPVYFDWLTTFYALRCLRCHLLQDVFSVVPLLPILLGFIRTLSSIIQFSSTRPLAHVTFIFFYPETSTAPRI